MPSYPPILCSIFPQLLHWDFICKEREFICNFAAH